MSKSTTIKRILKEAAELSSSPSPDYHAAPLESNLFEWHFTLRGPPSPSAFSTGIYHGRIMLPPAYPLRPPSFRFLTPSGRFEVNREICLSISGHHEETWQPAWGVRTALVAIRSLMDEDVKGQVGGMAAHEVVRRELAGKSADWVCAGCAKSNRLILEEQDLGDAGDGVGEKGRELVGKVGVMEPKKETAVGESASRLESTTPGTVADTSRQLESEAIRQGQNERLETSTRQDTATRSVQEPALQQPPLQPNAATTTTDSWIDKAIIGIVIALVFMALRRFI